MGEGKFRTQAIASFDMTKTQKTTRGKAGLKIGKYPGAENGICPHGAVEIRNEQIILHEPLASQIQEIQRLTGMTYKQMLRRAFELLEKELDAADAAKSKRAKGKSGKGKSSR